ncbi:unnamed protein product [marine sediment metagenome]|uniref:Uncharacterized protein n=1 Tax=marine sediment metagenome TaxID=412755 RepID=X0YDB5_9ZZZZ
MQLRSIYANTLIYNDTDYSIYIVKSSGNYVLGWISNMAADGFTVSFGYAGSSCAIVVWFAIE